MNDFLFSLNEKARNAIFDIFLHTRQHAPFMMRKVVGLIARQYLEYSGLPLLRENLLRQIEFEKSVDIEQYIDESEGLISGSFGKP